MRKIWEKLRINETRFARDFKELGAIGFKDQQGVYRLALSDAHQEARSWFLEKAREAGLGTNIDGAGNHSAILPSGPERAKTLLLGSHLDTVPGGGKYDGALGVLAALEVLRCVKEAGLKLPCHLEAIDFTDEEGTLVSFLGSFAFCGRLTKGELEKPRGDRRNLDEGIARAGLSVESILNAARPAHSLAGYLELHIEQGPILHKTANKIGIVENIAGIAFYRLLFSGKAGHAGTIDMEKRKDAAQGAAAFTLAVREEILEHFPGCFGNVGAISLEPGYFNIIPEVATVAFELRSADDLQFDKLKEALLQKAGAVANKFGLGLEIELLGERRPAQSDPRIQQAVRMAADDLNLAYIPIISRAGHDAQPISEICPMGMVFVPSVDGISHSPDEFTLWEDCVNGANTLLQATIRSAYLLRD